MAGIETSFKMSFGNITNLNSFEISQKTLP